MRAIALTLIFLLILVAGVWLFGTASQKCSEEGGVWIGGAMRTSYCESSAAVGMLRPVAPQPGSPSAVAHAQAELGEGTGLNNRVRVALERAAG